MSLDDEVAHGKERPSLDAAIESAFSSLDREVRAEIRRRAGKSKFAGSWNGPATREQTPAPSGYCATPTCGRPFTRGTRRIGNTCGDCAGEQNPTEAKALALFDEPVRSVKLSDEAKWHVDNTSDWATPGDER
jgi:hypothetical protein